MSTAEEASSIERLIEHFEKFIEGKADRYDTMYVAVSASCDDR